jgi:hypothetical protein
MREVRSGCIAALAVQLDAFVAEDRLAEILRQIHRGHRYEAPQPVLIRARKSSERKCRPAYLVRVVEAIGHVGGYPHVALAVRTSWRSGRGAPKGQRLTDQHEDPSPTLSSRRRFMGCTPAGTWKPAAFTCSPAHLRNCSSSRKRALPQMSCGNLSFRRCRCDHLARCGGP